LGEKLSSTPIPIYRRVFVINGGRAINEKRAPKLPLTISATYLAFRFVVVEVVELAAIVVGVEVEITVVVEEGVVLQRGLLVPCPSGGEEYCGVGAPLRYQFYTNSLAPTSWKDSRSEATFGAQPTRTHAHCTESRRAGDIILS
jgi:hypothetical protein